MQQTFESKIEETIGGPLTAQDIRILQVNLGYRCNMACKHCHVSAGPARTEAMDKTTIDQILDLLAKHSIGVLDITGGAPEMNPHFTYLVMKAKTAGCHVIVRSNLTIFFEDGYEYLPDFYRAHDVEISASLPYYLDSNVDRVRGAGTFGKSIEAIKHLNRLGYGDGNGRKLNLVYNPAGAFLAPAQKCLEEEYRRELGNRHGIIFDDLLVFSNMPVGRFRTHLEKNGGLNKYQEKLEQAFNPSTLEGLMCRRLISVGWDGSLYDCDFNQVLGLRVNASGHQHIRDFEYEHLIKRKIHVGDHCYGCTAGQGST